MDARTSRRQKRLSKKQEARTAADVGGRTQANSGATRHGGGDVRGLNDTRIECKFTEKDRYTLKLDELLKLEQQALRVLESPVFQFAFADHLGRRDSYAVVKWPHEETTDWDSSFSTTGKQMTLHQSVLQRLLIGAGKRVRVDFFITREDRSYEYEVMTWDEYLRRRES